MHSAPQPLLRTVTATRYLSALRSGSSVPILVEADDDGVYVLKLRGAAQGERALVAELIAGTIARVLGLPVPEIVLMHFDPALAHVERHAELRDLFAASAGLAVGLDYLPGATAFDATRHRPPADVAARIVLFDCFVMNVDRRARPNNLLVWHDRLYLIDHGAALAFHYDWTAAPEAAGPRVEQHVLWPFAGDLRAAAQMFTALDDATLASIAAAVPDAWLAGDARFTDADAQRAAYVQFLARRRDALCTQ